MTATVIQLDPSRRSKKAQPYAFMPDFQFVLATAVCCRQQLFGRIGIHLDPSCISEKPASLAISTAQQIAHETGIGPSSLLQVIQYLRRSMDDGKCMLDELQAVDSMFEDVQDRIGMLADDAICFEVIPVLRRRIQFDAAMRMTSAIVSKEGSLETICETLQKSFRLGEVDVSCGTVVDSTEDAEAGLPSVKREIMPTGISAIDDVMNGGLYSGTQTLFIGLTNGGKSMTLNHIAASFALSGKKVGYATLELTASVAHARIVANLTAVPVDTILNCGITKTVKERLEILKSRGLKRPVIRYFEPSSTTVTDMTEWLQRVEDNTGERVDCLVVDYVDRVGIPKSQITKDSREYTIAKNVMNDLQTWAVTSSRWCVTASQARKVEPKLDRKGRPEPLRLLTADDAADSMHKVRIPDVVITINGRDMVQWVVSKNRHGPAGMVVGPTYCNFSIGRVSARPDRW